MSDSRDANFTFKEIVGLTSTFTQEISPLRDVTILCINTDAGGTAKAVDGVISIDYSIKTSPDSIIDYTQEITDESSDTSVAFVGRGLTSIRFTVTSGKYNIHIRQTPYALR